MRSSKWIVLLAAMTFSIGTPVARGATKPPDLRTATVVDLSHAFDSKTLYWPTSPTRFELTTLASGSHGGGLFLLGQHLLRAGARRHAPRCADPLRAGPAHGRPDPRAPAHRAGCRHRRFEGGRGRPGLPPVRRGRSRLGEKARHDPRRRDRAPANRLEREVARPEALPGGRHSGRRVEPPLPVVRARGRDGPRPRPARRSARRRYRFDRSRHLEGLSGAPPRRRGERPGPREPRRRSPSCPKSVRGSSRSR